MPGVSVVQLNSSLQVEQVTRKYLVFVSQYSEKRLFLSQMVTDTANQLFIHPLLLGRWVVRRFHRLTEMLRFSFKTIIPIERSVAVQRPVVVTILGERVQPLAWKPLTEVGYFAVAVPVLAGGGWVSMAGGNRSPFLPPHFPFVSQCWRIRAVPSCVCQYKPEKQEDGSTWV